jgi:hypothetical protein
MNDYDRLCPGYEIHLTSLKYTEKLINPPTLDRVQQTKPFRQATKFSVM